MTGPKGKTMTPHTWYVGDVCFVVRDKTEEARVVKVGRRWLSVRTESGESHAFDLKSPHWDQRGP